MADGNTNNPQDAKAREEAARRRAAQLAAQKAAQAANNPAAKPQQGQRPATPGQQPSRPGNAAPPQRPAAGPATPATPPQRPAQQPQQRPAQPAQQRRPPAQTPGQRPQQPQQRPAQPQQQRPAQPARQRPPAQQPQQRPQQRPAQPAGGQQRRPAAAQAAAARQQAQARPAGRRPVGPAAKKPAAKVPPKRVIRGASSATRRIAQILVDLGFIDEDQQWDLLEEAKNSGQMVGQVAIARGLITETQLYQALAEQFSLKLVNLSEVKPTPEAIEQVPETMASVYKVVPLTYRDGVLTVAIGDPNNLGALDDLRNFLSVKEVRAVLAPQPQLEEAITSAYAGKEESIMDIINSLASEDEELFQKREESIDLASLEEMTEAAPVRKLLNMVLLMAIKDHASDIHFEPFEDEYKMRYRCDGVLYEMVPPPRHLAMAISTRIKVMANLDIAERRLPQDGRIELNVGGNPVDMRVSVLPTMFGESVVIRVLDRSVVNLDLTKLGMEPHILASWQELIHRPNGIILVTGPTGSGKTTTLYSSLNELNEITEKIITTEDPIEYDIDGIIQVPINPDIDVTFANALRAILRQDPDIILVGEIRDLETAQIAVQAALTGHTVFSTLHTNDAPSTVTRLRDMGVEPYLITATVQGILAQRLVRRICEDCRTEFDPSDDMLMELNLRREQVRGRKFYYGRGCDRCNNTGYRHRGGIFELITVTDELRDLISSGASTDQLREACRRQGMTTLRESGLRAIFSGMTTIDEVVRETIIDEEL